MKSLICLIALVATLCGTTRGDDPSELVFVFQKQKDPAKIQADADQLAAELSHRIGRPVKAVVPGDYTASVQALVSRKADFAYVSALPFLLARRDGNATLLLAEQRTDLTTGQPRTDYASVFVVPADSPLKRIDDLVAHAKDLRLVFTSPTSTSGYIIAYARLVKEGLLTPRQDPREVFKSVAFGGGYTQALEQLLQDRGDVAAVSDYVLGGPRADSYLPADDRAKLRVLAHTPGVPTHGIAARDGLSDALKQQVKQALIAIAAEKPELIADVYGATAFVEVDEQKHVQAAVDAVEAIGLPIEGLAK